MTRRNPGDIVPDRLARQKMLNDVKLALTIVTPRHYDLLQRVVMLKQCTLTEWAKENGYSFDQARIQLLRAMHPVSRGLGQYHDGVDDDPFLAHVEVALRSVVQSRGGRCGHCEEPIDNARATGRPRRWCSDRCRQAAYRARRRNSDRTA